MGCIAGQKQVSALWAVPVIVIALMAVQLFRMGRRWARGGRTAAAESDRSASEAGAKASDATYDAALERELSRLDDP
jgi:cytochrome c-type biogenesis protein CcmH/NrfF